MTVSAVQTEGHNNWNNWVTGFHLYYSNDGQRWTGYSKSGDVLHSNVSKLYLFANYIIFYSSINFQQSLVKAMKDPVSKP